MLPALGLAALHDATPAGPVTTVLQLVAVYVLAELGPAGTQEATGVGPVVASAQDVVV